MSTITSTQIVNMALGRLSQSPISSLTANSRNAEIANRHYDNARKFCLKLGEWSFATERAILSKLDEVPLFGWNYVFALPNDFLTIKRILGASGTDLKKGEYAIEGTKLLTNDETIKLVYVIDREAGYYGSSPEFVEFLFMKLASLLVPEVTVSESVSESVLQKYQVIEDKYIGYDDESDTEPDRRDSDWTAEWD